MSQPTSPSAAKVQPGQPCPCGSGRNFEACCQPVLSGAQPAATAEALMRARFTAHVVHDFRFLHASDHSNAGRAYVEEAGEPSITWQKLDIHAHEPGADANTAYVDFSAYGTEQGAEHVLHEKSEFRRIDGKWIYVKALRLGPAPFKSAAPKVGRNDPCPCGSGKKYKHCCLLV
jgi:SEC-C motif-containing protein